jgi:hypothetical protein
MNLTALISQQYALSQLHNAQFQGQQARFGQMNLANQAGRLAFNDHGDVFQSPRQAATHIQQLALQDRALALWSAMSDTMAQIAQAMLTSAQKAAKATNERLKSMISGLSG